jgi:hypothetical protein
LERTLKIRNQQDFAAGFMYIVVGLFFASLATGYQMGTAAKMGPGYFPFCLGMLLAALGLLVLLGSITKKAPSLKLAKWDLKSVIWITGSVILYGVLLSTMGFFIALLALVFISASASHEYSWKGTILNALILLVFTYLAFVVGLKLQFPLWPFFLNN